MYNSVDDILFICIEDVNSGEDEYTVVVALLSTCNVVDVRLPIQRYKWQENCSQYIEWMAGLHDHLHSTMYKWCTV